MNYLNLIIIIALVLAMSCLMWHIDAHGMMLSPVGRSSRWRYDSTALKNYDDSALYCGGLWKQTENGGMCGLCGDDYSLGVPRPNENGGKYGNGIIVKTYKSSSTININILITANHLGYFSFHLCSLDEFGSESENCFDKYPLEFEEGVRKYYIGDTKGPIDMFVQLPKGVFCQHCVLRWTYTAGNNWGPDQENFKNCADVSILSSDDGIVESSMQAEVPVLLEESS